MFYENVKRILCLTLIVIFVFDIAATDYGFEAEAAIGDFIKCFLRPFIIALALGGLVVANRIEQRLIENFGEVTLYRDFITAYERSVS